MIKFDRDFRMTEIPSDSDLQDFCDNVKSRMEHLVNPNNERPLVSINICAHDEERYLPWTSDSISRILTNVPMQICVIDNASRDRTSEIALQCWVQVITEPKKWLSYARQVWLEWSKGEYIFSTDSDVRVPNSWIDASLNFFREDSELVCFSWGINQRIHPLHSL